MKLRNKKTGEIGNLVLNIGPNRESYSVLSTENGDTICGNLVIGDYDTLIELNEEWEDAPEKPKEYWYVEPDGSIIQNHKPTYINHLLDGLKSIGNYFETKEEAKKAVEKQKALERLRENGFRFDGFRQDYTRWSSGHDAFRDGKRYIHFNKADDDDWLKENWEDLKLVFREEE